MPHEFYVRKHMKINYKFTITIVNIQIDMSKTRIKLTNPLESKKISRPSSNTPLSATPPPHPHSRPPISS